MKKKFIIYLTATMASMMPFQFCAAQDLSQDQIESALEKNQSDYFAQLHAGELDEIMGRLQENKYCSRSIPENFRKDWDQTSMEIITQTLNALNELIQVYPEEKNSKVYEAIQTCSALSNEEIAACGWYQSLISATFIPETGNELEEKVDDLSTEYYLRKLLFEASYATNMKDYSEDELNLIRANLELEFFQNLLALCNQNEEMHQRVNIVQDLYVPYADSWRYLLSLTKARFQAVNEFETKVVEAMKNHRSERKKLYNKVMDFFEEQGK